MFISLSEQSLSDTDTLKESSLTPQNTNVAETTAEITEKGVSHISE